MRFLCALGVLGCLIVGCGQSSGTIKEPATFAPPPKEGAELNLDVNSNGNLERKP